MKERNIVLITDIDNTLYDFVDFFGMAFRGMLHAISDKLHAPENQLMAEFKDVFKQAGTLDYQFLIQSLASVKHLNEEDIENVIRYGRIGFDRTKRKRLKAYQGIIDTLRYLDRGGVYIIGVTNAPYYHAIRRMQDIGAFQFFSGLVAWEGVPPPESDQRAMARYSNVRDLALEELDIFKLFPKQLSKPNPFPFLTLRNFIPQSADIYSLGDSISKDLAPSKLLNAKTIWARYGTIVDEKNLQTVLDITPWSEAEINLHSEVERHDPDHIVDQPEAILKIIPHWKTDLFQ